MNTGVWNYRILGISTVLKRRLRQSELLSLDRKIAKRVYLLLDRADRLLGRYGKK